MTCPEMKKHLAERVFESRPLPDETRKHIAECAGCTDNRPRQFFGTRQGVAALQ